MTDNNGPVVETKEEPAVETKPVTEKQEITEKKSTATVSYTHLTLPTILLV